MGGFVAAAGDGVNLTWTEYRGRETSATELDATPQRWRAFWAAVERLDCWSWAARYEGTTTDLYCAVSLSHNGRHLEMRGDESGVPPNWEPFCTAVSKLARKKFS